jgi:hypothetical protein
MPGIRPHEAGGFPAMGAQPAFHHRGPGMRGRLSAVGRRRRPLNTVLHSRGIDLPEVCISLSLNTEGAGNAGCALHPRSRVQCAQRVRTRAYRAAENIRHSLRNGFTAYNALSPVSHVLLPPSTPTSGRQDHTSLPYALAARVTRCLHVHRNPPLVVTTADALLGGTGWVFI